MLVIYGFYREVLKRGKKKARFTKYEGGNETCLLNGYKFNAKNSEILK